jgi:hypothetical protein
MLRGPGTGSEARAAGDTGETEMLISHDFRFIFTKTAKTAGTSVEAYFERFCLPPGQGPPSHHRAAHESVHGVVGYRGRAPSGERWYNHMPASEIRDQIDRATWDSYFKFCTIRNPWDKTISAFEFMGREHLVPLGEEGQEFRSRHPSHDEEQLRFLHWLETEGVPRMRKAYVIDGALCVDDVVRYERLPEDLERICRHLGVPWDPAWLPRFKTEVRREESTVSRLYREPARQLVAEAYDFEIQHFGYRFPV